MIAGDKMAEILARAKWVEEKMNSGVAGEEFVALSKEFAELNPLVEAISCYQKNLAEREGLQAMLEGADAEMKQLAKEEMGELSDKIAKDEEVLKGLMVPKDSADMLNVIIEVRAGTGGDEAALFAGVLLRMYQRFSERQGWKFEPISFSEGEVGGCKEAVAAISGKGVYAALKFESGVHRVQRVPETESAGRVHTSAASVAVLPEPLEVDVKIEEKDLRVDVFRASGPGGQSVNTTDSAVRITHLPSGIVVTQQDEKSQHKNRAKAMKVLRARLYEAEREKIEGERAAERRAQIGSGDRSERIRTYNYPEKRVSDHRINLTLHKLDKIVEAEGLDELIEALQAADIAKRLAEGAG
ncbi:MAG: peptide chain release factor 1 [Parvibaculales bacterium]